MAAALLTPETVTLHNIPYVRDIITQRRLLEDIGATVLTPELRTHKITASHIEVFAAWWMVGMTVAAVAFAFGGGLTRREGAAILALYAAFAVVVAVS